jgi:transposase InsO family protein
VPTEARGNPATHDTTVDTVFTKRAASGSLWQACIARMAHRAAATHLEISVLHGDGTNTVATKGAMELEGGRHASDRGAGYRDHRPSERCRRTGACCSRP